MSRITKFDRPTLRVLGDDIKAALEAVARTHGIKLTMKGGRFDDNLYTPKMEFSIVGEGGTNKAAESEWNQYRGIFGMPKVPFGAKFTNSHGTYTICGVKLRSNKYPILGSHVYTGKVYKFRAEDVARWTGAAPGVTAAEQRVLDRIHNGRGLGSEAKAEAEWERKVS